MDVVECLDDVEMCFCILVSNDMLLKELSVWTVFIFSVTLLLMMAGMFSMCVSVLWVMERRSCLSLMAAEFEFMRVSRSGRSVDRESRVLARSSLIALISSIGGRRLGRESWISSI